MIYVCIITVTYISIGARKKISGVIYKDIDKDNRFSFCVYHYVQSVVYQYN